jgi:class 3 adenylate cyclase
MTVLFADLKDSTELSKDLDPEAAQQLLDPAIHRMMEAVHRFEGTVNQVPGDGMMALFGAPIAHEGHALRACYVALAMQGSATHARPGAAPSRRPGRTPAVVLPQALALVEKLGMRPLVAHCHLGLGMLYSQIGRVQQACAELTTAIELYRAMDMTFWLPQAEAALAKAE